MSYIVNAEIPKHCNKCPFGMLRYSTPLSARKHGYICNLDFKANGEYTKIMENDYDLDVEKPDWCPLVEVKAGGIMREKQDLKQATYERAYREGYDKGWDDAKFVFEHCNSWRKESL